ncbi:MAG: exodeoxyribonuclease VII large subunit [Gammaproteobacteria bacterium]|nr:exodeoxyribonuclease VII large subunit [Gammaproteobacteria bacterium]
MPDSSVYTVAEINQQVRTLLLENFSEVIVRGEISGLKQYASGHWYFTLKDPDSEIRCAMFRNRNRRVSFAPQDGDAVRVQARVDLYVQRGSYQLVVEDMEPEGRGELLRRLEETKAKLRDEGLFDPSRKQPLPAYPSTVGVITSSDGAALRDVARTLRRRWPVARLCVYPSRVQGEGAPTSLAWALEFASQDGRCDVLILARGGGSFEDLLAFSDEAVVRAVAACPIPLVTGIGHETDTSLADFAADVRAATPTAAAEQASPDSTALKRQSLRFLGRIHNLLGLLLKQAHQELGNQTHRLELAHPAARIRGHQQRLDETSERLVQVLRQHMERRQHRLALSYRRLIACSPKPRLAGLVQAVRQYRWRMDTATRNLRQALRARLEQASGTLEAVSPLRTLERGYSIATLKTPAGPELIRKTSQADVGDAFELQVSDGSISAEVTEAGQKSGKK